MVDCVLLDAANALKISRPGVDVKTAADADLLFSSAWCSAPVFRVDYLRLSSNLNVVQEIVFGRTFPGVPLSIVALTGDDNPATTAAALLKSLQISGLTNRSVRYSYGQYGSGSNTAVGTLHIDKRQDKIVFESKKTGPNSTNVPGCGQWVTTIVFDDIFKVS
jgi:hypothetical protein